MVLPLVSVVIPVNPIRGESESLLPRALKSIRHQTYESIEVLIQNEEGIARARNEGIRRANGKYIAVQDSDDISYPERIEKEVRVLEGDPTIVGVGSWADTSEGGLRKWPLNVSYLKLMLWNWVNHSSFMVRADAAKEVGYCESAVFEDYALYPRLLRYGRIVNIQEALVKLGVGHRSNTSKLDWGKIIYGEIQAREVIARSWISHNF